MRSYADVADLPTFTPALADPQGWIERASGLVEAATMVDHYNVDDDGMPIDQRVVDAFRDATVAQVKFWVAAKIDPVGGVLAQSPEVSSQSTDGSSVSYGSLRTAEALEAAINTLCADSARILRLAALTGGNAKPFLW